MEPISTSFVTLMTHEVTQVCSAVSELPGKASDLQHRRRACAEGHHQISAAGSAQRGDV